MPIQILDTHTINKIAAGEVIERPCSIVKELVENSIDAKASAITLEIKNGGIDFIRITDNGIGIPKEEVEIAFLRHATSKIETAEDLQKIVSLGFRGEALASIAAVAHVEILTRTANEITGKRLVLTGGKIITGEEVACPEGTTLIIRQLFYNVPARKAFLSSKSAETAKITDFMEKLAFAHPEVSFQYIQNGKTAFATNGKAKLLDCVRMIYSNSIAQHIWKCYEQTEELTVFGLLGDPAISKNNRHFEHFFINGRSIKNTLLQQAVEEAYQTLVMVNKFPFVIIHLTLPPDEVDVNIHPNKLRVRFKNQAKVYQTVMNAIRETLKSNMHIPKAIEEKHLKEPPNVTQLQVDPFFTPRKENLSVDPKKVLGDSLPIKPNREINATFSIPTVTRLFEPSTPIKEEIPQVAETEKNYTLPPSMQNPPTPKYTLISQLFKTYWLIRYQEKLYIMDQHAAHERVLYEKYLNYFQKGETPTQMLLVPESYKLSAIEYAYVLENLTLWQRIGFQVEPFGDTTILIREVPFLMNEPVSVEVFVSLIEQWVQNPSMAKNVMQPEQIMQMACKKAVKAHDALSTSECEALIESLLTLENPFTCPHGRPTLVELTEYAIEKIFKRT